MSQHDFNIDNQSAPAFRSDLNNALEALGTLSSGPTAPAATYANMQWYDTANNILKMRSEADDAWINIGTLNQSTNTFTPAGVAELSQAQAENDASTVFGQVSGQRLAQAVAAAITSDLVGDEGYVQFANGLIFQWGLTGQISGTHVVSLPIAFTTNHICGFATVQRSGSLTGTVSAYYSPTSLTTATITHDAAENSSDNAVQWLAIGA